MIGKQSVRYNKMNKRQLEDEIQRLKAEREVKISEQKKEVQKLDEDINQIRRSLQAIEQETLEKLSSLEEDLLSLVNKYNAQADGLELKSRLLLYRNTGRDIYSMELINDNLSSEWAP